LYLGIPASSPELMVAVVAVGAQGVKQTQEQTQNREAERLIEGWIPVYGMRTD